MIDGGENVLTNIRMFVADADQVSGYPSNTQAANVSKDTTVKEVISIGDIPKDEFKTNNINLFFGNVNAIDYCSNMLNFPTVFEALEKVKEKLNNKETA